ncbi:hypothetical protein [Rhizobium leucaenae]|uniref:hypothetical protein n=1 Tax=Rhizobium leucaenae TaxID=29450 RepID=UPI0004147815|nr:hypothetical protein [Rhizobium leucaenae]
MTAFTCNPVQGRKHKVALSGGKFTLVAEVERGLWATVTNDNKPLEFADKRLALAKAKELSREAA